MRLGTTRLSFSFSGLFIISTCNAVPIRNKTLGSYSQVHFDLEVVSLTTPPPPSYARVIVEIWKLKEMRCAHMWYDFMAVMSRTSNFPPSSFRDLTLEISARNRWYVLP